MINAVRVEGLVMSKGAQGEESINWLQQRLVGVAVCIPSQI